MKRPAFVSIPFLILAWACLSAFSGFGSPSWWTPNTDNKLQPSRTPSITSIAGYSGLLAPGKAISLNGTDERASIAAASLAPDNFETGSETVTNGTLESDLTNWTTVSGTAEIDVAGPHLGVGCAKLTTQVGGSGRISQTVNVTAGDRMALVFWAHGDGTNPGRYQIVDVTHSTNILAFTWLDSPTTWRCYRKIVDVPAGCSQIKIEFASAGTAGNIAYFDDVTFRKIYDLSFMMWVKRSGSIEAGRQYIWCRLFDNDNRMWHWRTIGTGEGAAAEDIGKITWAYRYEGTSTTSTLVNNSTTVLQPDTWYLVAATYETAATTTGFVHKLYVNGVLEGTVTTEGPIYPGDGVPMSFGATMLAGSEHWFAGEVGESQIVRGHAFSAAEMLDIYSNGIRESYSDGTVIAHYDWRGTTDAGMLLDISSQSNNLIGENITQVGDQTTGVSPYFTRVSEVSRTGYLYSREATSSPRGGSAATIDDTKGNSDTTFTWSADKLFDTFALYLPLTGGTLSGGLVIEHANGVSVGKASTTSGAVQIYNNSSAFPFQIYSGNNTLPGNGWITPVAKPSADGSTLNISTTGVMTYAGPGATYGGIPTQTDKSGQLLTTNGTTASWTDTIPNVKIPLTYDCVFAGAADGTDVQEICLDEQTVLGRVTGGHVTKLTIDSDLSAVSASDDTLPSAKATKAYTDGKFGTLTNTKWCTSNGTTISCTENAPAGSGDFSSNTAESVDSEIVLFSGTGGKTGKRATTTGILKGTSGVLSAATAGTDYVGLASDNTLTGANIIGDGSKLQQTYLDSTPGTDDTWGGVKIDATAGEAITQWDLVYSKNAAGTNKWYKYDANGTDKLYAPRGIAISAAAGDGNAFVVGVGTGIARNDGWGQTSNQDEGKTVYASTTAGAITLTAPSTSADEVAKVGYVLEENVVLFNLGNVTLVEVP